MPKASAASLQMAVEAAQAAAKAAAHTAGLILIEANGGRGHIQDGYLEQRGDSWCVVSSMPFTAHLLADSHGDRAHIELTRITPATYEQMRTWAEDRNACHHDQNCECLADPWPTLDFLTRSDGEECRIDYRDDREDVRGTARLTFGHVTITLYEEPVTVVDTLIRIAHAAA
ncbi:hypothetical protein ACFXEL_37415 [Streptomyces sp. NPDC059382]|uniref:hypothetical protein n=1 Tax=Streptomyces sp. NPDC059382 TaxID=3346816 RepID=UPI0036BE1DDF